MKTHTHKLNQLTLSIVIALTAACAADKSEPLVSNTQPAENRPASTTISANENESDLQSQQSQQIFFDRDRSALNAATKVTDGPVVHERKEEFRSNKMKGDIVGISQVMPSAAMPLQLDAIRPPGEKLYREQYEHPEDQQTLRVTEVPVSTFSIDVDTGAYSNMRRWISQGQLPPENAVRVEEFINYFDYDYPQPENASQPFLVETEIAPTPWNSQTHLLRIGIQGYEIPSQELPASNLVFLVDVSGSMNRGTSCHC